MTTDRTDGARRSALGRRDGGRHDGRPAPSARDGAPVHAHAGQWAAWAFLAPVVVYLVAFYAYPLYRNLDLSLRDYTVASFVTGDAPFVGLRTTTAPSSQTRRSRPRCSTHSCSPSSRSRSSSRSAWRSRCSSTSNFRLSATLRALFLVPWLLPLIVSASTWSWMLNSDSGVVNSALHARRHRAGQLADLAALVAGLGDHREHLDRHPVQPGRALQRPAEHPRRAATRPPRSTARTRWQRFWRITFPLLRPVSAITLLLGLVYTLKVFDIIWIMTTGGPADASTTFATWSYRLGFGNLLPDVRPRRRGRQHADRHRARLRPGLHPRPAKAATLRMNRRTARTWWKTGDRPASLTALMLFPVYWMINVSLTRDQDMRKTPPNWFPLHGTLDGYRAVLHQQLPYLGTSLLVGLGTVAADPRARRAGRLLAGQAAAARAAAR